MVGCRKVRELLSQVIKYFTTDDAILTIGHYRGKENNARLGGMFLNVEFLAVNVAEFFRIINT
jgi:hypothetical protein